MEANNEINSKEKIVVTNTPKTANRKTTKDNKLSSQKKLPRAYLYFIYFHKKTWHFYGKPFHNSKNKLYQQKRRLSKRFSGRNRSHV